MSKENIVSALDGYYTVSNRRFELERKIISLGMISLQMYREPENYGLEKVRLDDHIESLRQEVRRLERIERDCLGIVMYD